MSTTSSTFAILGRKDAKLVRRDSFLIMMGGYMLVMAIIFRYAMPWMADEITARGSSIVLSNHYPMIVAFIAVFNGALLSGVVSGFLLLDEREGETMRAMLVTPIPVSRYLLYRVVMPTVTGFVMVLIELVVLNPLAPLPLWQMLLITAGSSLVAPVGALFFASFAENKVQGFALMKITGIGGMLIAGAWFVDTPLQYLFGLFPPFWVSKAYWMALEGAAMWPAALTLGIVLQIGMIVWLMGQFKRTIYRHA